MVNTSVVLVEEHDQITHGTVLVQMLPKALCLKDSTGKFHEVTRVVVLTERTLDAILDTLRDPNCVAQAKKILPADISQIQVTGR